MGALSVAKIRLVPYRLISNLLVVNNDDVQ